MPPTAKRRRLRPRRRNNRPPAFRGRIVRPACYRATNGRRSEEDGHACQSRGMGAGNALPVGGGPGAAGRARRTAGVPRAASVRLPGRRAGRPAGRAARAGRRGGSQGRRRRAHAAAAVGRRPRPAPRLARAHPPGRAGAPAGADPAGRLAGAGAGLHPGRRAGPAPRGGRPGRARDPGRLAAVPGRAGPLRRRPGGAWPGAAGPGHRGRELYRPLAPGARRHGRAARA